MDGILIIGLAVVLFYIYPPDTTELRVNRSHKETPGAPRLNPSMQHEEGAFMVIAHELGF